MTLQQAFFLSLLALAFLPDEIKSSLRCVPGTQCLQFVTFNAGWEYRDHCIHEENSKCKDKQSQFPDIRALVRGLADTSQEIRPKNFGRRNQLAHVLLQIAAGVDFIGIQEDRKDLFQDIKKIQDNLYRAHDKRVLRNPIPTKEQFHKKYLIPFNLKFPHQFRNETKRITKAVWTDEKYNKLLSNLPFYKQIVPSYHKQRIGQLYNTKTLKKIENSNNLCFNKGNDGTPDNGRPYQISIFEYKNKKVLVVNAHGPHVSSRKTGRFPTRNFNEYFTQEKLSSKLTQLDNIDLIVFQGDLNRGVEEDQISVGSHRLKWAGHSRSRTGKPLGTFCGSDVFTNEKRPKFWRTVQGNYPRIKKDNMLWWSSGRIQTEAIVLDYIGPVSDHMMVRGTFKFQ